MKSPCQVCRKNLRIVAVDAQHPDNFSNTLDVDRIVYDVVGQNAWVEIEPGKFVCVQLGADRYMERVQCLKTWLTGHGEDHTRHPAGTVITL